MFAPSATKGKVSSVKYDHFSLLRTTEEMLGLPFHQSAASAPSMRSDFNY